MRIDLKKLEKAGFAVMFNSDSTIISIDPKAPHLDLYDKIVVELEPRVGKYAETLADDLMRETTNLQIMNLCK